MTLRLAVTGASGATGRLVVSEVAAAGHDAIAIGRDRGRLREAVGEIAAELRTDEVTAKTFADVDGVINCAGPFLDLDRRVAAAAVGARVPYTDVSGEAHHVERVALELAGLARDAGVAILPGNGFSAMVGGLAAATAITEDTTSVLIAYGIPGYRPTPGSLQSSLSLLALQTAPRWHAGAVEHPKVGRRLPSLPDADVVAFAVPDALLLGPAIPHATVEVGVRVPIRSGAAAGATLRLAALLARHVAGRVRFHGPGRSPKTTGFRVDVVATSDSGDRRRVSLTGRDIYRTTATGAVATIEAATRTNLAGVRAAFEIVEVLPTIARLGLASTAPPRPPVTQESR
jgi:hypothetical protein